MLDRAHGDGVVRADRSRLHLARPRECDVVLLHRDEAMRAGLRRMLLAQPDIGQVTSVEGPSEFVEVITEQRPAIAIVSSDLEPDMGQTLMDATARCRTRVLLLMHSLDRSDVVLASSLRVDGFLVEHGLTTESLGQSIRTLREGGLPVPPSLVRELLSEMNGDGQGDRPRHLTPREHATLELVVEGLSNKQIARRLEISEHGAKRHVANVLAKLNCPNRTMAAAVAVREGLVAPS